jgi:S-adenosylmethionine:tRNA ribosyltransferase-isomerase
MRTDEFDYKLPPHLIAQQPLAERESSRLLVVRRDTEAIEHRVFRDLPDLLAPGDLLVLNDTRVISARLVGRRARTGGHWEGLFLAVTAENDWELMCQTRGRLRDGEIILIEPGPLQLTLVRRTPDGTWIAKPSEAGENPEKILSKYGHVPLPPYIRKGVAVVEDRERYQTVYATEPGAVAAPTSTPTMLPSIRCTRSGGESRRRPRR